MVSMEFWLEYDKGLYTLTTNSNTHISQGAITTNVSERLSRDHLKITEWLKLDFLGFKTKCEILNEKETTSKNTGKGVRNVRK